MILAVGSTRGPKVEAVRRVLAQLGERAGEISRAEVVALDVQPDAPPMPLSVDEILDGARSRAHLALEALQAQGRSADMAIGMEGGIDLRRPPERPLRPVADNLERLAVRQRPLDGPFDVFRVAGSQRVGHGISLIWRMISSKNRYPLFATMR